MPTQPDALFASDYVVCATLRKIPDVFNVELLWERVRGGQEGLFLMDALKRHPRAPRGRQRKETRYSHVIVRIPERDYVRDERLEDGLGRRTLLRELHRLHEQELARYLAEHATIRYRAEADTTLRAGEVQFLFGRAIYLPDENETPIFLIQAAAEGAGDWRDVGPVYSGQRLTLLNGDRRASSFAVTAWPFPGGESVLLMLQPGTPALVDMVAEPPGGLVLVEDDTGSLTARDRRGRGLRLRVIAAGAEPGTSEKPTLMRAPSQPRPTLGARADEPVLTPEPALDMTDPTCPLIDPWGRRQPKLGLPTEIAEPAEPRTPPDPPPGNAPESPAPAAVPPKPPTPPALDQHTWIPQRPPVQVQVLGIALQRLSTYAAAGISDWRIGFNHAGGLTPSSHPDAAAWLRVDSTDRVFGEVVGLETPLELPGAWRPFPELRLDLHAAPQSMTAHYLGWVRLPTPLSMPVPRERAVSFGRGSEADIAPRLLADPRSLRWDGNPAKTSGVNAEYLGLSRRHLRLQVRRDDWWVQLESQNMSVYRLAPSGELLDVLSPGVNTAATAKPGELLVAGGYVLALGAVG
ncbi:MAG: hypothetical protein P9F75_08645 [Candidatus Contendobacter sp.]|nr:hypothetical protein [Candidatus Contendobacter sp.]